MYQSQKVSFREAMKLIEYSINEAEKLNEHIAVSVSGPEGELIAFTRMDRACPAASKIARNKSYTAAVDRKSTKKMGEFMNSNQRPPAFWGDSQITGFGGGMPIVVNGQVIGGIGVSGLSEEEDERIPVVAIEKVFK